MIARMSFYLPVSEGTNGFLHYLKQMIGFFSKLAAFVQPFQTSQRRAAYNKNRNNGIRCHCLK